MRVHRRVGLKALALGTQLLTKHGDSMAVQGMDLVANAGVGAFFHTLGAGHGAKSAGVTRFMTTASADKVKAALPGVTILGEIPQAPAGNFLSARDLAAMAAR